MEENWRVNLQALYIYDPFSLAATHRVCSHSIRHGFSHHPGHWTIKGFQEIRTCLKHITEIGIGQFVLHKNFP